MMFLTWCINRGQALICYVESKKLYTINPQLNKESYKSDYKKYKRNLRKYGFSPSRRDFQVFRNYMIEGGSDPAFIIPAKLVHCYLTSILNPIPYNAYFEDKNMFDKILPKEILPTTLFRRMDGKWYNHAYKLLDYTSVLKELKELPEKSKVIIKPSKNSSSGKGVKVFEFVSGQWSNVIEKEKSLEESILSVWGDKDIIIQEVIKQHSFFSKLSPTAVSTMRIVVYNSPVDGEIHIIWRGLRVGGEGSIVDNNHAGGLMFGLDEKGKIYPFGTDQCGNKYTIFNGIDYSEQTLVIPNFDKVIRLVKEITPRLLPHRFIAYDIAQSEEGKPIVIEYNLRGYGGWVCQFAGDYMLGDKTKEILQYLSENKQRGGKVFYNIN